MNKRFLFFLLLIPLFVFAKQEKTPLPQDQAFVIGIETLSSDLFNVTLHIAPNYYLYRDQLRFSILSPKETTITHIDWPSTTTRYNAMRGKYQAYEGNVLIPVVVSRMKATEELKLNVHYQGCSAEGFCYPPMEKSFSFPEISIPIQENQVITNLFEHYHFFSLIFIFFGIGMLLSLTPCVLPMIPILSSIIVGQGALLNTKRAFLLSFSYVLGMALTYALAGLSIAWLGSSIQVMLQRPLVIIFSSMVLVLLALSLFGVYELRMPQRWQNKVGAFTHRQRGGTYAGVFFMGGASTLVVSPCVTAPLAGVLAYIAMTGNLWLGGFSLFAMGLGMGVPLMMVGISAGKWLPRTGPWMVAVKSVFGVLMLGMAAWMLSRTFSNLSFMYPFKEVHATQENRSPWLVIRNTGQLEQAFYRAKQAHQAVMLDFYADWCESCLLMEREVFQAREVKKHLSHFVWLRADITQNDQEAVHLMKRFSIIAPPTILFFDKQGKERKRIVGEEDKATFLMQMRQFHD